MPPFQSGLATLTSSAICSLVSTAPTCWRVAASILLELDMVSISLGWTYRPILDQFYKDHPARPNSRQVEPLCILVPSNIFKLGGNIYKHWMNELGNGGAIARGHWLLVAMIATDRIIQRVEERAGERWSMYYIPHHTTLHVIDCHTYTRSTTIITGHY